jgi:hypothetical protein
MAHTLGMIPPGLVRMAPRAGLPDLGGVDFVLLHGRRATAAARGPAEALADAVLAGGDRLQLP